MRINKKVLLSVAVILPVLFVTYLALNDWHLIPKTFMIYGGKTSEQFKVLDTSVVAGQYRQYCAGCHGQQMNTFVKHDWKFGKTKSAIFKAVKYGYPDKGMPGYELTFNDKEIYDLSNYLLAGIDAYKNLPAKKSDNSNGIFETELLRIKIDTVAAGLGIPWCIAFLPGGDLLVTDRGGKLFRVNKQQQLQVVNGVPKVKAEGQGGLFDVLLHPDFANNKTIYLSYSKSKSTDPEESTTAIVRAKLDGTTLSELQEVFEAKPYSRARHHYGGKMLFDKAGYLYFSVGERGNEKENPQSLQNDLGKIHRVKEDGSIPADNPFVALKNAKPSIYCYGNRNPQGLAVNPQTGAVWENEHGPMGGDELNLIEAGKNYGWPVITYGINYNGRPISDKTSMEGMEQPLHFWVPSIATSGLAFVHGNKYKGWEGDVLSGSLKFHWLSRCRADGNVISSEESMLKEVGRLRDVRVSPDGYIYIAVENPGFVFRLTPLE